jgi:predicted transcriptional regulator
MSSLHPYVVFLPTEEKDRILSAIFGSRASLDILRFFLKTGISNKVYQKDLVRKLSYSNKTIIENLKVLTKLGILTGDMEKKEHEGRIVWIKAYTLSDAGKWFALLLAEEKELSDKEKAEILQNIFRSYIKWVKNLSEKLHMERETFKKIFSEEIES